jgi:hypothetical protein
MQMTNELEMHWVDLKSALKQLAKWWQQFKFPKWAVGVIFLVALAIGWLGGHSRGAEFGFDNSIQTNAFGMHLIAKNHAEGKDYLNEQIYALAIDQMVAANIQEKDMALPRQIWRMTSPYNWRSLTREQRNNEIAQKYAEQRLSLVTPPTPETIAALRANQQSWRLDQQRDWYEDKAKQYSKLLGREIKAERLVPDASLRQLIELQKKSQ